MSAMNIVRMRVKPEHEAEFLERNRTFSPGSVERLRGNGLRRIMVVKTGEHSYCLVGEWDNFDSIVKSRPEMIGELDRMRGMLEDLGGSLGVTDPVSGDVVIELTIGKAAPARPPRTARRTGVKRSPRSAAQPKKTAANRAEASKRATGKPRSTGKSRGPGTAKPRSKR